MSDDEKSSEAVEQATKKQKVVVPGAKNIEILGEHYWALDKMRFARVNEFKGKKYVDIREYYIKGVIY